MDFLFKCTFRQWMKYQCQKGTKQTPKNPDGIRLTKKFRAKIRTKLGRKHPACEFQYTDLNFIRVSNRIYISYWRCKRSLGSTRLAVQAHYRIVRLNAVYKRYFITTCECGTNQKELLKIVTYFVECYETGIEGTAHYHQSELILDPGHAWTTLQGCGNDVTCFTVPDEFGWDDGVGQLPCSNSVEALGHEETLMESLTWLEDLLLTDWSATTNEQSEVMENPKTGDNNYYLIHGRI